RCGDGWPQHFRRLAPSPPRATANMTRYRHCHASPPLGATLLGSAVRTLLTADAGAAHSLIPLSLGGLRRRIEAAMLPDAVTVIHPAPRQGRTIRLPPGSRPIAADGQRKFHRTVNAQGRSCPPGCPLTVSKRKAQVS